MKKIKGVKLNFLPTVKMFANSFDLSASPEMLSMTKSLLLICTVHLTVCSCHVTYASSCSHFTFRFLACFEQGFLWHSGNHSLPNVYVTWQEHTVNTTVSFFFKSSFILSSSNVCGYLNFTFTSKQRYVLLSLHWNYFFRFTFFYI